MVSLSKGALRQAQDKPKISTPEIRKAGINRRSWWSPGRAGKAWTGASKRTIPSPRSGPENRAPSPGNRCCCPVVSQDEVLVFLKGAPEPLQCGDAVHWSGKVGLQHAGLVAELAVDFDPAILDLHLFAGSPTTLFTKSRFGDGGAWKTITSQRCGGWEKGRYLSWPGSTSQNGTSLASRSMSSLK